MELVLEVRIYESPSWLRVGVDLNDWLPVTIVVTGWGGPERLVSLCDVALGLLGHGSTKVDG